MKTISVIIPNYNGRQLLERNLPTVYTALGNSGLGYEIIIADDASEDDSVEFVKTQYPDIILVQSPTNSGFATNINRGIFKAKGDLLLLLNSDVSLEPDYFKYLLHYFELPDTFSVMGRLVPAHQYDIPDFGVIPHSTLTNISSTKTYLIPENASKNFKMPTFTLGGANALVSHEKLIELKGFNETFSPYYREDFELGLRAWRLGWKSYYEQRSVGHHEESATIKKHAKRQYKKAVIRRNKLILNYIHMQGMKWVLWILAVGLNCVFRILLFDLSYYWGMSLFIRNWKKIKQTRADFYALCQRRQKCLSLKEASALFETVRLNPDKNY